MKSDPNYHGYAHTLDPDDPRVEVYSKQRSVQGFDDSELWNLDETLIKLIYPRLKRFIELYPQTDVVDSTVSPNYPMMLVALEGIEVYYTAIKENTNVWYDKTKQDKIELGLKALAEIFPALWT